MPVSELLRFLGVFIFGCDLSYKAYIGSRVSFTHYGLGVVVGKYAYIEDEVVVMPSSLIGATLRDQGMPTLKRGCVIGAGAKVLGRITVGQGAVVAANSVVLNDVPEFTVVAGNPCVVVRERVSESAFDV